MRRRSWIGALLLMLVAVVWFSAGALGLLPEKQAEPGATAEQPRQEKEPFAVEVMVARAEVFTPELVLSARSEPLQRLMVRARASGEVVQAPLREGAAVRKGELLCQLDETSERAQLAAARAALQSAERDAKAAERLFRRGTLPDAQLKQAQARLQQAKAALRQAELALQWRQVLSPIDAVLQRQVAKVGDVLAPGAACAELVVIDPLKVVADASELEVGRLKQGMQAQVHFVSGGKLQGSLTYIAPAANEATRTFRIEAQMANPQGRVRAGMTARLVIPLEERKVVRLPLSSLVLADDGRLGVHIVQGGGQGDGTVAFRPLRIVREGREAVLVEGLADGARVIVNGQYFVREGQRVRAVERKAAGAGAGQPEEAGQR